jgi:hypothetical protein
LSSEMMVDMPGRPSGNMMSKRAGGMIVLPKPPVVGLARFNAMTSATGDS